MSGPVALFALLAVQAVEAPQLDPGAVATLEEVQVLGRRPADGPSIFSAYRNLCFEPNRLDGRAAHPVADPGWSPLSEQSRTRLGLVSADVQAYAASIQGAAVLLKIEETTEGRLQRHQCSLTVAGPHDPTQLEHGMTALFGGSSSQRHLGIAGYRQREGWRQLAWAAIPRRGSTDWTGERRGRSSEIAFVVVVEPSFYRDATYVVAEMQTTTDPVHPVTLLTLSHTFRARSGE